MDGLYARNVVIVNRNHAKIFPDDVSEVDSVDEGSEYCEDGVERREGDSESAKDATLNECWCNGVDATDNYLFGMDKT
jgi:hypothetical protein